MKSRLMLLGRSVEGRRIEAFEIGRGGNPRVLVLGGTHGDEPKSVDLVKRLIEILGSLGIWGRASTHSSQDINTSRHHDMNSARRGERGTRPALMDRGRAARSRAAHWLIVPCVNPDGYERRRRRNARGVDLNRNFPTKNWARNSPRSRMHGGRRPGSEPETRAVMRAVERHRPHVILTIHSINKHRYCVNYDGPAKRIARRMSRLNGYPLAASIGYPTPGSFGTWAGIERHIPTITLELPSHRSGNRCWEENTRAMMALTSSRLTKSE